MAEETTIQEVGAGTEVQIVITMEPLKGEEGNLTDEEGNSYSLSRLEWSCYFEASKLYKVMKKEAVEIDDNSYKCICKTDATDGTGKGSVKAWLDVTGIPSINRTTRREVTVPIDIKLEVV